MGGLWEEPPLAPAAAEIFITLDSTVTFTPRKEDQNKVSPGLGVTLQAWLGKDTGSGFKPSPGCEIMSKKFKPSGLEFPVCKRVMTQYLAFGGAVMLWGQAWPLEPGSLPGSSSSSTSNELCDLGK